MVRLLTAAEIQTAQVTHRLRNLNFRDRPRMLFTTPEEVQRLRGSDSITLDSDAIDMLIHMRARSVASLFNHGRTRARQLLDIFSDEGYCSS